jgi:CBS domain
VESIAIPAHALCAAYLSRRPAYFQDARLSPDEAAIYALTDFDRESPICVAPDYPAQDALKDMIRLAIHSLLVVGATAGWRREFLGLVTFPMLERCAVSGKQSNRRGSRPQHVDRIMTPPGDLALVHYESLRCLQVLDLFKMFQGTGLTHVLVIQAEEGDSWIAKGLISRAAVARRLCHAADMETVP